MIWFLGLCLQVFTGSLHGLKNLEEGECHGSPPVLAR